ncbi:MAG TPA: SDR family oxidoreductase [Edaphobacter sp.]
MIVVTGATGHLGRLVVAQLLETVPAGEIVAAVRTPSKAADLAARGVVVHEADYAKPETLAPAFTGAQKVLLISSSELGIRVEQHKAVIDAAKSAGVEVVAYTSVLRADTSHLSMAKEHLATEQYLKASGLKYIILRNGWYIENDTEALGPALAHGAILGASQQGRISGAARSDYAAAAVKVLTGTPEKTIYELAGDASYSKADIAAEVSKQSGKQVVYQDLPPAEYEKALESFGLPAPLAQLLADSDAWIAQGELEDNTHELSRLIGRPTSTLADGVAAALKK